MPDDIEKGPGKIQAVVGNISGCVNKVEVIKPTGKLIPRHMGCFISAGDPKVQGIGKTINITEQNSQSVSFMKPSRIYP